MPQTRTEKIFLAYSLIYGILTGLLLTAVLESIAVPNGGAYLLTLQEQRDFTTMAARFLGMDIVKTVWMIALPATLIYLALLLPVLNPAINSSSLFKEPKKILRLGVWLTATLIITIGLASRLDSFFGAMNMGLFMKISGVAIPIVWWSVLGEIGIAGNLSTWKPQTPDIRTCTLFAISAYLLFIVLQMANSWSFSWFFTLVSEVLDGSGEFSVRGFTWFRTGLVFLAGWSSLISSAIIIGFAPTQITRHTRIDRLILPIGMLIVFSIFLSGGYYIGVIKYDLDKTSLAEAIQADQSSPPPIYTAILKNTITSKPWIQSIKPSCMTDCGTIPVSLTNIGLLRQYLNEQPQSIFRYGAEDAIVASWFQLWDSDQATKSQYQTQNDMLQRMVFLNRLSALPITPENQRLLDEYRDESRWWVGHKAALRLASAAIHFNDFDQARHWLTMARTRGASDETLTTIAIPAQPRLVHGEIHGRIQTDRPVIIALLRGSDTEQGVELDTTFLSLNLVDNWEVATSSTFSFKNLGEGRYFLALKYGGERADISMSKPRYIIEVTPNQKNIDLGTINLIVGGSKPSSPSQPHSDQDRGTAF